VTPDSAVVCILLTLNTVSGGNGVALSETSASPYPILMFLVTFSHIKRRKPLPSPCIVTVAYPGILFGGGGGVKKKKFKKKEKKKRGNGAVTPK
jgi:hypothetical protein